MYPNNFLEPHFQISTDKWNYSLSDAWSMLARAFISSLELIDQSRKSNVGCIWMTLTSHRFQILLCSFKHSHFECVDVPVSVLGALDHVT
jgi:hypothetical protein